MALTERERFNLEMARQLVLGEIPCRNARKYPERIALVFGEQRIAWGQLDQNTNRLGNALMSRGVKRGDKVAVLMRNRYEIIETYFSVAKIGGVSVPLNFRLAPREISHMIINSDSQILVYESYFQDVVDKIKPDLPHVEKFIVLDGEGSKECERYADLLAEGDSARPMVWNDDDDPSFILYTSGTTGLPKGAVMTHKNFIVAALTVGMTIYQSATRNNLAPPQFLTSLMTAPLFHVAAISNILRYAYLGHTVIVHEFETLKVLKTIETEKVTYYFGVPTMWKMLMDHPDFSKYDVSSIRYAYYGAAPMLPGLRERILENFPNAALGETFGQTEMSPVVAAIKQQDAMRKNGSVGEIFFNVDFRVVDDDMNDVPAGQIGEAVYRGGSMFQGYYKNSAADEEAFRGGWFHSGDLVRQDEEGFLYVVDRKKDMIISGGENIYSAEIEELLMTHPKITEAAVIGVPDPKWGEAVKAYVVLKANETMTAEDIIKFCTDNMARYKQPKFVEFMSALPRNASGKVLKRDLRPQK